MDFDYFFHDCLVLGCFVFVDRIIVVNSFDRLIGWYLNHVHLVDVFEFFFLCLRRTSHTR